MFIIIKHGDNQEFLVNSNCTIQILLHYVRTKTGLRKTDIIDLCDESGTLKLFFLSKTPGDYACKFLTARNTYYVCKVERGAPGKEIRLEHPYKAIVPLLKNATFELLDSLRTQCEFLERSRIKLLRALEAKRLAALEASKSSMRLQARRAKSRTKQAKLGKLGKQGKLGKLGKLSSKSKQKSKGGRPEDNRGRRGYYKSRTHFQNTLYKVVE
uniref:uncharacterized protein CXorf65 homolog n=1 Tax=Jaculus jaculus TaxID=51337 RepID=UPI00033344DE|nr:uncharacterized protein CXorf65 homolog [Jaculus jaculus]